MNDTDEPIGLTLVTGFLGAGKTTLVNALLRALATRGAPTGRPDIGLLVNDFGTVVVDGALIMSHNRDAALEIFEVADGSIFCTCKSASFVAGLRMFSRLRPRRLIVEASGMSDPSGLSRLLRENRLAGDYRVDRTVCVVDAVRYPKLRGTLPALDAQIAAADVVMINKADLVAPDAVAALRDAIATVNRDATVVVTSHAAVEIDLITGPGADRSGDLVSCSTPETRPAALQLEIDSVTHAEADRFLRSILDDTYRIKGWARVDGDWRYVSDNSGRIEWDDAPSAPGRPAGAGVTVICPTDRADAVAAAWRAFASAKGRPDE